VIARRGALVLAGFALILLAATPVRAADGPIEREIQGLFWAITWFALLVSVIVFGALFWFMIRYRRSVHPVPQHIEGNKTVEFVWTVFPTVILIVITAISVPVLLYTDVPPPADTTVTVQAQQFSWKFVYEDGTNTSGELWIQEDVVVHIRVTSLDVIHSFAVPQLGIKLDAIPGRYNEGWVIADSSGDYLNQCAEFCGTGHYGMRAVVHVFPAGSHPKIYGPPAVLPPFTDVELRESGGNATRPWSISPAEISVTMGSVVRLRVWNNNTGPYTFRIDDPIGRNVTVLAFSSGWLNFTAPDVPSDIDVMYGPTDSAARDQGMVGTMHLQAAILIELIDAGGLRVNPNPLTIPKNQPVKFLIRNEGALDHNFTLGGYPDVKVEPLIPPGGSVVIGPFTFTEDDGGQYWCAVPGHREQGMWANYAIGLGGGGGPVHVPIFEMMALTFLVGGVATFAYVVHHARRPDEG